jgi:hypothetical protein
MPETQVILRMVVPSFGGKTAVAKPFGFGTGDALSIEISDRKFEGGIIIAFGGGQAPPTHRLGTIFSDTKATAIGIPKTSGRDHVTLIAGHPQPLDRLSVIQPDLQPPEIHLPQLTLRDDVSGTSLARKAVEKTLRRGHDARDDGDRLGRLRRGGFVEIKKSGDHSDEHQRDIADKVSDRAQRRPGGSRHERVLMPRYRS